MNFILDAIEFWCRVDRVGFKKIEELKFNKFYHLKLLNSIIAELLNISDFLCIL